MLPPEVNHPTDRQLLRAWERGTGEPLLTAALRLLQWRYPDLSLAERAHLPIGERDVALLHLRRRCFGDRLQNLADCPGCGETMEWEGRVSDLLEGTGPPRETTFEVEHHGQRLRFRLPNSEDILQLPRRPAGTEGADFLLQRCLLNPEHRADAGTLTEVAGRAQRKMATLDPGADLRFSLRCAACDHGWTTTFDILSYLRQELDDWAQKIFSEISQLAFHYGWSEADILAMNPRRRKTYLNLLRA